IRISVKTIYDVARVAGVSTATVSRVLRGSDLVRADTRQRVLSVIEALGFIPDASARGLSWGRKGIIALVGLNRGTDEIDIERSSLMFIDHIVHAAEQALRGTEYSLLLTFGTRGEQFDKRIRALAAKADGLLLAEEILDPRELRSLTARVPVVVIAGSPGQAVTDAYLSDNASGMTALAAHLTGHLTGQHGYHRLCFVAGPKDAPDAVARQEAFQQAVACANDQMAIGAVRELQRAGVRVPADVAVTGFDDLYPSRIIDPPLTTVSQPIYELGSRATHRLMERIASPGLAPRAEFLPTRVVIRTSCGCPPREDENG